MMELCPSEAIHNNVLGTQLLADLSVEYGVERFVMVSTDKAVNPTNVMGASKRLAEIYVQTLSANPACTTRFITTRFGNVLGSNGSVILRFKQQIENREALTVTHPDIQRYFMTIPEASQLVLEAGIMGQGGEIFVFDMGKPVSINEMARKMIRLYGYEPDKDIEIRYTGLRPGEKMFEELLSDGENLLPTHNTSILIARVRTADPEMIQYAYQDLKQMLQEKQAEQCFIQKLKKLVPEYNAEMSIFA
jgi:FlaA1/EpsC-like NDP-sugar epimerase